MTIRELQQHLTDALTPVYGDGEARWLTRLILASVTGKSRVDLLIDRDKELTRAGLDAADAILGRLLKHEPIQYILGYETWMGLKIHVGPGALIPRLETQELVELILDREGDATDLHVLDAGTGSGAIAVALARNLRFPHITAIDNSSAALDIARDNARRLTVTVTFVESDMLALKSGLPGEPFDIIVSNPPYVMESERKTMDANVTDYEPAGALFVPDSDPLVFYNALCRYALGGALKPGGRIYFECNPLTIDTLADSMREAGFGDVGRVRDSLGHYRFLTAKRQSE